MIPSGFSCMKESERGFRTDGKKPVFSSFLSLTNKGLGNLFFTFLTFRAPSNKILVGTLLLLLLSRRVAFRLYNGRQVQRKEEEEEACIVITPLLQKSALLVACLRKTGRKKKKHFLDLILPPADEA